MLRDLACHTSNFVAEHEFREKVARVTSVLNMTRFTVYIVFSEHRLVLVNFATVNNRNRVKRSTTITEICMGGSISHVLITPVKVRIQQSIQRELQLYCTRKPPCLSAVAAVMMKRIPDTTPSQPLCAV